MTWPFVPSRAVRALACATGLALAAACGGGPAAETGTGSGEVVSVDRGAGELTISHGEIPGLMGAMTMTFEVADPALLADVEAGDRIEFDLRYADGTYTVTGVRPAGEGGGE